MLINNNMRKINNYYLFVMLLFFVINTCKTHYITENDLEDNNSVDNSGPEDNITEFVLKIDENVCILPIDEGDCRDRSLSTSEESDKSASESNELKIFYELKQLEEMKELNALNEIVDSKENGDSNSRYFGYNRSTKQCEQFNYDGCGGNENRFESMNECRKTCYTPLKYFLSRVRNKLLDRFMKNATARVTTSA